MRFAQRRASSEILFSARMPNPRRQRSPLNQLEFCFEPQALALPSVEELRSRAVFLLEGLHASSLAARVRVKWNARMRTAVGRAEPRHALITLNPVLQNFGLEEIDHTLRHELAHLLAQDRAGRRRIRPHGSEWRRACRELDLAHEPACHRLPIPARQLARPYLYRCGNCRADFPRVRPLRRRIACLACCRRFARGGYDERFRLRLVKM
ncbi:MAG: SprT-like domain-containing protein [Chthoniobacterales bacterium]